jgi:hypothetical protein
MYKKDARHRHENQGTHMGQEYMIVHPYLTVLLVVLSVGRYINYMVHTNTHGRLTGRSCSSADSINCQHPFDGMLHDEDPTMQDPEPLSQS